MPTVIQNNGSAARDYCMLERNILAHIKLALLLSLVSSSILLRARLVPSEASITPNDMSKAGVPMGTVQMVASLFAIVAGVWEYCVGCRDLRNMRAFLVGTKPHLGIVTLVSGVVFTTLIVLLADEGEL